MTVPRPKELVAYYRVSTDRQGQSGLGLDAQRAAVREYAGRIGAAIVAEFDEVESGFQGARPHLAAARERARISGATLVVAKLDRMARDVRLIMELMDSDVSHIYLDYPDADVRSASGWLMIVIASVMAEYESRRASERVKAALARRREKLIAAGILRPKPAPKPKAARNRVHTRKHQQRANARWHELDSQAADLFRANHRPIAEALREKLGTLEAVAEHLNQCGIKTRRGKRWTVGLVHALLKEPK